jgi:hypothetical protein
MRGGSMVEAALTQTEDMYMLSSESAKRLAELHWGKTDGIRSFSYTCGGCGNKVASNAGYQAAAPNGAPNHIYICPMCHMPTVHIGSSNEYAPGARYGEAVENVPDDLASLYEEARTSIANGCHTGSVLLCRKILMHIAVEKGAEEGKQFRYYVEFLSESHYVPPDGKGWVDYIRVRGNEANHEIRIMKREDAEALISFVGMLLKLIFEFPNRVPVGIDVSR